MKLILCPKATTMKVKVIFKMAKEPFDAIGCMWYFWIVQVVEHVGQSFFYGQVRTPQQLIPDYAIGIGLDGKLLERSLERVIFICSKNHPYG